MRTPIDGEMRWLVLSLTGPDNLAVSFYADEDEAIQVATFAAKQTTSVYVARIVWQS